MFELALACEQKNGSIFVDSNVPTDVRDQTGFGGLMDILTRMSDAVAHPGYWPISTPVAGDTLSCFLYGSFSNFKTIQEAFKLSSMVRMYIMENDPIGVIIIFSNEQTGFSTYLGFNYNPTTRRTTAGFLNENPVEF